jgi:hypothetical protein
MMRGILILLLFALGGPVLAWQGYKHRQFRAQLAAEGTTVQAEAHGGELRTGKRSSAKLEVSYQAEGRMIHKTMPVSASFMKSISNDDSLTVDSVALTYLKSDPEQAVIVDGTPDTSPNLWIGAIVALIGWGGGAYYAYGFASEASEAGEKPRKKKTASPGKKRQRPVVDDDE